MPGNVEPYRDAVKVSKCFYFLNVYNLDSIDVSATSYKTVKQEYLAPPEFAKTGPGKVHSRTGWLCTVFWCYWFVIVC